MNSFFKTLIALSLLAPGHLFTLAGPVKRQDDGISTDATSTTPPASSQLASSTPTFPSDSDTFSVPTASPSDFPSDPTSTPSCSCQMTYMNPIPVFSSGTPVGPPAPTDTTIPTVGGGSHCHHGGDMPNPSDGFPTGSGGDNSTPTGDIPYPGGATPTPPSTLTAVSMPFPSDAQPAPPSTATEVGVPVFSDSSAEPTPLNTATDVGTPYPGDASPTPPSTLTAVSITDPTDVPGTSGGESIAIPTSSTVTDSEDPAPTSS